MDSDGAWTTLVPSPRCPGRVSFDINRDDLRHGPRCPHPLENAGFLTQARRTSSALRQLSYRAVHPAFSTLSTAPTTTAGSVVGFGGLIQTALGSGGGTGRPFTKRSG